MPQRHVSGAVCSPTTRGKGPSAALPHARLPSSGLLQRLGCPSPVPPLHLRSGNVKLVPSSHSRVWDHWGRAWEAGLPLTLSISQQVLK